ncbi:MAG: hypothetical protein R6U96_00115 [Promethearchaeia archaeon]
MPLEKHKYYNYFSQPEEISCAVCRKCIYHPIAEIDDKLKYSTRIDRALPGDTSHLGTCTSPIIFALNNVRIFKSIKIGEWGKKYCKTFID